MQADTHCRRSVEIHHPCMVQLAIRCQPRVSVSADELQGWLELEVHELRSAAPHGTVRLSRLTQEGPSADLEIGWLIELELTTRSLCSPGIALQTRSGTCVAGLEPTLLTPRDAWTNGRAA